MEFRTKVQSRKIEGRSKEAILSKINLGGWTGGSFGSHYMHGGRDNDYIRVVNLHKVNKKVERFTDKKGKKQSRVIKSAHWIGYYYDIPKTLLTLNKLEVIQKSRNFVLQENKR